MSGKRINNLAEHYLGSKNFTEATAVERNRFLDEVVRRYVRDANKKYCVENKYLLAYRNHNNGDSNHPWAVSIDVLSLTEWVLSPYRIDGRYRRCDSEGNVTIRCPYVSVLRIDLEYSPAGWLEHMSTVLSTKYAVPRHSLYLTTNVNDLREGGLNYDLTNEEVCEDYRLVDVESLKNLRVSVVPAISGQSEPTDVIRRLRAVLDGDLVLEPKTKVVNTIKAID